MLPRCTIQNTNASVKSDIMFECGLKFTREATMGQTDFDKTMVY